MTLLFDLDGTLVDCKDLHFHALNGALKANGYKPISFEDHESIYDGLPTVKKLEILKVDNPEKINRDKQTITRNLIPTFVDIDKQVASTIKQLHREYRLFCVSNSKKATIEIILQQARIEKFFVEIISCEDVALPKPAPDIYAYAKYKAQDECIAFEDNQKGLISAQKAGIKCFHVIDSSHIRYSHIKNLIQYA
jgi:HAD superfamily hydrolase (TIGR01509 family)